MPYHPTFMIQSSGLNLIFYKEGDNIIPYYQYKAQETKMTTFPGASHLDTSLPLLVELNPEINSLRPSVSKLTTIVSDNGLSPDRREENECEYVCEIGAILSQLQCVEVQIPETNQKTEYNCIHIAYIYRRVLYSVLSYFTAVFLIWNLDISYWCTAATYGCVGRKNKLITLLLKYGLTGQGNNQISDPTSTWNMWQSFSFDFRWSIIWSTTMELQIKSHKLHSRSDV